MPGVVFENKRMVDLRLRPDHTVQCEEQDMEGDEKIASIDLLESAMRVTRGWESKEYEPALSSSSRPAHGFLDFANAVQHRPVPG